MQQVDKTIDALSAAIQEKIEKEKEMLGWGISERVIDATMALAQLIEARNKTKAYFKINDK